MKTNHILTLLAGAALMLSSCVNESELNFGGDKSNLKKDEIAFKMGVTQVRSEASSQEKYNLGTITTSKGSITLEDQVESLDDAMATRGTPVFTANAQKVHSSFYAVGSGSGKTFLDAEYKFDTEDEFWKHHYAGMGELWDNNPEYTFFMRMPGSVPGVKDGAAGITNNSDGSMSFDYSSPDSTATGLTDILFTSATVTKNGSDITFYHALTGVKFSNYFDNKGKVVDGVEKATTKTIIKKVRIAGLKKSGHCVVTPGDDIKSKDAVAWTNQDSTVVFVQDFTDTTNYKNSTMGLDTLLKDGSKVRNLNDKDGTMTFWFIPQSLAKTESDSVTLTVIFDVEPVSTILPSGETVEPYTDTLTVTLSTYLDEDHRTWQAGQLHTFTLRPTAVGVEINDKLSDYVKEDVVVENIGNVYQYVRVNIIANWTGLVCEGVDSTGQLIYPADTKDNYAILMGYPSDTKVNGEYVDTLFVNDWNDKDFTVSATGDTTYRQPTAAIFMKPYTPYGKFVGLPYMGTSSGPGNTVHNWVRHDKYYYYTKAIGPGESVTDDLFESYTVGVSPAFYIVDKRGIRRPAKNVHLEMDLAVQAIEAPMKLDGTEASNYEAEWIKALNPENDPDFNFNDL